MMSTHFNRAPQSNEQSTSTKRRRNICIRRGHSKLKYNTKHCKKAKTQNEIEEIDEDEE
jgi:hypothetical protein